MIKKISGFLLQGALSDNRGADTVEWVAIIAIIVITLKAAVGVIAGKVNNSAESASW